MADIKDIKIVIRSRFVKIAPDKIRLVGKALVNKKITEALDILNFLPKAAAKPLISMIKEAISRAKERNLEPENLLIKTLAVDEGPKLKRRRIIHRGRATSILKRSSHITVVLTDNGNPKHASHAIRNLPRRQAGPKQITKTKQITNKQNSKLKK